MGLLRRGTSTVGLDIGSGFIKLVELDHSGDQPEVVRVAMSPLLSDAIVEGEIMDASLVAETIRGLLADAGSSGRWVVAAVGGHDVIIKKIEMDPMPASEAREVIRWEAEEHVPFDIQSVELDFQILPTVGDGRRMEVLIVAAKRELVENRLALLGDAGLEASVIDVDAFALHNAFEHNHPEGMEGLVALVNVGHEMTNVNILEDGVPILTRDLPFGARKVREALQKDRGLTSAEAEAALLAGEVDGLPGLVEESADQLAVSVERATAVLLTKEADATLGRVYLSGGGSRIPGLAEGLGRRMAVEVHGANPFERVPVRPDAPVGLSLDETAPLFLLPLGLALRAP